MLIFHEGLPRSGKSYEAVVKHIIPSIKAGRKVYARMDGFDKEQCLQRIADLIESSLEDVRENLIYIAPDDVPKIPTLCSDNSLVVIDEIAKYFPQKGKRSNIGELISDFVKEHGHRGIDILAMDQDLRDVNALWRRRVDRKLVFMKMDVLGAKGSYKWKLYKAISGENFELVGKGTGKYDKKYFGTYDSHVSVDINTDNYSDDRAVIWKRPAFKYGIPFLIIVFIAVPLYIISLFDPSKSALVHKDQKSLNQQSPSNPSISPAVYKPPPTDLKPSLSQPIQQEPKKPQPTDYVKSFIDAGDRVRLVSVIASQGREPYIVIEFRDESLRVKERLDNYMIKSLGWYIQVISLKLVKIKKPGETDLIATSWPIDYEGKLSATQNEDIRRKGDGRKIRRNDDLEKPDVKTYQVNSGLDHDFDAQQYVTLNKLEWVRGAVK